MYFPGVDVERNVSESKSARLVWHDDSKGVTHWKIRTVEIQTKGFIDESMFNPDKIEDVFQYKVGHRHNLGHIERDHDIIWDYRREGIAILEREMYEVHLFEVITETVIQTERLIELKNQEDQKTTKYELKDEKPGSAVDRFKGAGDFQNDSHVNKTKDVNDDDDDSNPYIRLCCCD